MHNGKLRQGCGVGWKKFRQTLQFSKCTTPTPHLEKYPTLVTPTPQFSKCTTLTPHPQKHPTPVTPTPQFSKVRDQLLNFEKIQLQLPNSKNIRLRLLTS